MHAVDRDGHALEPLRGIAKILVTDLETGPWPFGTQTFGGVVVTNYLWRPLLPHIVRAVAISGVLIYETFALGNETVGKPRNPAFLLRPGELLDAARPALRLIAYEDGFVQTPKPAYVQRICAVREPIPAQVPFASAAPPAKYNL